LPNLQLESVAIAGKRLRGREHLRSGVGGREEIRADLGGKETEDQEVERLDEGADRAGDK
jgi:hypothetical protein